MAMMTSDQIDHLHVLRDVAISNSSELIHLSHRVRLWSLEEFRFSEEANKATSSEKRKSSKRQRVTIRMRPNISSWELVYWHRYSPPCMFYPEKGPKKLAANMHT